MKASEPRLVDPVKERAGIVRQSPLPAEGTAGASFARRLQGLSVMAVVLIVCFAKPLYGLVGFALHSELYSHTLLIPFISVYLVWLMKSNLALDSKPKPVFAIIPLLSAAAMVGGYWVTLGSEWQHNKENYFSLMTASFVCCLWGGCFLFLGWETLRAVAFPLAFLAFAIPFPAVVHEWLGGVLQHGSADAAYALLKLSGMPVFRQDMEFQLPGFSVHVAPECSGLHSSLVLFITSFLAGHLLLRRTWSKTLLVLAVIPLGLLRNGFRIFVLGQLCVRLDPDWINSDLHHRGGPLFFALSLIPLFYLLILLRRRDFPPNPSRGSDTRD